MAYWDKDFTARLVSVDGQTLTVDMRNAESVTFGTPFDATEGTDDGGNVTREFTGMATVTFVARVPNEAIAWEST